MSAAVIVFPGSNCDRDCKVAVERSTGERVEMVWHQETALPSDLDLIVLPGGFSYGDYLRCGAMAVQSPIMQAVRKAADDGVAAVLKRKLCFIIRKSAEKDATTALLSNYINISDFSTSTPRTCSIV